MAAASDIPVQVPVDDPNADTEWNEILRKHKVIPERPPSPRKALEEAYVATQQLLHETRLEGKDLDELDELEDLEDDDFLESYKRKRIAEMDRLKRAPHGQVYPLTKAEYSKEVTEVSMGTAEEGAGEGAGEGEGEREGGVPVLVNLTALASGHVESRVLSSLWRAAATKYPDIKFCEMRADLAIENYPERNCPTVLVYRNGNIVRQIVTLKEWGGVERTRLQGLLDLFFFFFFFPFPFSLSYSILTFILFYIFYVLDLSFSLLHHHLLLLPPYSLLGGRVHYSSGRLGDRLTLYGTYYPTLDIEALLVQIRAISAGDIRLRKKADDGDDEEDEGDKRRREMSSIKFSSGKIGRGDEEEDEWD